MIPMMIVKAYVNIDTTSKVKIACVRPITETTLRMNIETIFLPYTPRFHSLGDLGRVSLERPSKAKIFNPERYFSLSDTFYLPYKIKQWKIKIFNTATINLDTT